MDQVSLENPDSIKTTSENESSLLLSGRNVMLIYLSWILASLSGATLGGFFIGTWFETSNDSFLILLVLLLLSGVANGMLQVLVLQFDIRKSIQWILINGVSWLAGGIGYVLTVYIFFIVFELTVGDFISNFRMVYLIIPISAGFAVGTGVISTIEHDVLIKWYGFDRQWNRAILIAWVVAGLLWLVIAFFAPGSEIDTWVTGGFVAGLFNGFLTGKHVVQLIKHIKRL